MSWEYVAVWKYYTQTEISENSHNIISIGLVEHWNSSPISIEAWVKKQKGVEPVIMLVVVAHGNAKSFCGKKMFTWQYRIMPTWNVIGYSAVALKISSKIKSKYFTLGDPALFARMHRRAPTRPTARPTLATKLPKLAEESIGLLVIAWTCFITSIYLSDQFLRKSKL